MGDKNACSVVGIGTVKQSMPVGNIVILTKVRHVPNLKRNLISLGMLDDCGCEYHAEGGKLTVYRNKRPILFGIKMHGLYVIDNCVCNSVISSALIDAHESAVPEPGTCLNAISCKDKDKWHAAMLDEMNSLYTNKTLDLVKKSEGNKLVHCKWLHTLKEGQSEHDPPRHKARLVANGFTRKKGIDFHEIFAPVVNFKTVRLMLSFIACFELKLEQLDVKTSCLHDELNEDIYMHQSECFVNDKLSEHVCLLKRLLYGLKQSPSNWYKRFDNFVLSIGVTRSNYDSCMYDSFTDSEPVYILLYVDDMLLISKSMVKMKELKLKLNSEFIIKDFGPAKKILGMVIERNRKKQWLKIHHRPYLEKVWKFKLQICFYAFC
ncbi:unnamed protein product [Rhodiola kirilowii]